MPYDAQIGARRPVSPATYARLQRAAQARPKIVFAGEFSAGKSTLLNALLQISALPTKITATALPPVWLRYGAPAARYEDNMGRFHSIAIDEIDAVPMAARCLHVTLPIEILKSCDFIDLPGISDPHRHDSNIHRYLSLAHMVVWCSPATQAWRQSERSTWLNMPARLHAHSVLVLTRGDKLDSERDRAKVLRRVQTETKGLFGDYLVIEQAPAQIGQGSAHPLMPLLHTQVLAIAEQRAALLQRYEIAPQNFDAPVEPPHVAALAEMLRAPEAVVPEAVVPQQAAEQPEAPPALDDIIAAAAPLRLMPEAQADEVIAAAEPIAEPEVQDADDLTDEALIASLLAIRPATPEPEAEADAPAAAAPDSLTDSTLDDIAGLIEAAVQAPVAEDTVPQAFTPQEDHALPQAAATPVAQEVQMWRDLVAEADLGPESAKLAALFDRYLLALSALEETR